MVSKKKGARRKDASSTKAPPPKDLAVTSPTAANVGSGTSPGDDFPVVGIGASAGGLEAFTDVLRNLPCDTGMAYVFVQHLDPRHESALVPLLARATGMPVTEAKNEEHIQADHVYVIPPHMDITVSDRMLRLQPRTGARDPHMPVDLFLRSLAAVHGSRAIGVVLSGTGTDGTLGLKAIKAAGGITFSQEPNTARYDGMPRSAIGARCADFVLATQAIARELGRLARDPYVRPSKEEDEPPVENGGDPVTRILAQLRKQTSADFSSYRRTTLLRRLKRRMTLHRIRTMDDYARFLAATPKEVQELHDDVLINVTSFFRDPATFTALSKRVFPRILGERTGDGPVRVWVPGCATGEEAYSIAICLLEATGAMTRPPGIQLFATDLSAKAVEIARVGFYLDNISADVSPERLSAFFTRTEGGYRVSKAVRDVCVFAQQDMTRDPPFSRLDLISCRNTLIYLDAPLQRRVLAVFHYALAPGRFLVLGAAEMVSAPSTALFTAVDREHKVFAKRPATAEPILSLARGGGMPDSAARSTHPTGPEGHKPPESYDPKREVDRVLAERYAPAGVLVDTNLEVLEFRGDTSPWLRNVPGAASLNVARMGRGGVATDVRHGVQQAARTKGPVRKGGFVRGLRGSLRRFTLDVIPVAGPTPDVQNYLVLFQDETPSRPQPLAPARVAKGLASKARQISQLEDEMLALRQGQQTLAEDHQAAMEELQSANEEVLSSNEELQSINEELETAKEELQSSNEELTTLNEELQNRNAELGRLSDDVVNLLDSVDLPIVMLGRDLSLRRFTASAGRLLNLIPADIGRPLSDLRPTLEAPGLQSWLLTAIKDLSASEHEVRHQGGQVYSLRIRPYRTADNRIDGVVMLIVNIDALKRSALELTAARDLDDAIVDTVNQGLLILDAELRVERANSRFHEMFAIAPEETLGRRFFDVGSGEWRLPELMDQLPRVLHESRPLLGQEIERVFPRTGKRTVVLAARRVLEKAPGVPRILLAIDDVTEERAVAATREALSKTEGLRATEAEASRMKDEFVATISHELRGPLSAIAAWVHVLSTGTSDTATWEQALIAIDRGVRAEARLIDDLLDLSRMLAGKITLSKGIVDLVQVVEAALETVRTAAEAKQVRVDLAKTATPALVRGDPDRLQQIVWNLLSNAVKFTPHGGRVEVAVERAESLWRIRVADTGMGIPPELLPHVFERFRQGEGATRKPGLGLGLAIVRHLVEMHGGEVEVTSEGEGKGSVFTVHLPAPAVVTPPETIERTAPHHSMVDPGALAGVRILLVEDDADARDALVAVLEHYGAEVTPAASAEEGLNALARGVPDLIVSDLGMPGQDGYDFMRAVRELPAEKGGRLPALALSAYASTLDRQRAIEAGFQRHVAKPAEPAELVATLVHLKKTNGARAES